MDPLPFLVVTTDPERARRLSEAVSAAGHQAVPAATGAEAAEALGVPLCQVVSTAFGIDRDLRSAAQDQEARP